MASDMVEGMGPARDTSRDVALTSGARQSESREVAELQTRYLMAQRFRRDVKSAFDAVEVAFSRQSLAEMAEYQFARGSTTVKGPTIRTLESVAIAYENIAQGVREVSRGIGVDGIAFSEVEAYAVDLQARVPKTSQFIVKHWRDTKQGGYPLRDERDIFELIMSQAQRRLRGCMEAVIPRDLVEHALEVAARTLKTTADTSPAALAKMVEAFAEFGVTKDQIERKFQRHLQAISAAQVVQMKRIYASLRDGVGEAGDFFDMPPEPSAAAEVVKGAARKAGKGPPAQPPPAPPPQDPAPPPSAATTPPTPPPAMRQHAPPPDLTDKFRAAGWDVQELAPGQVPPGAKLPSTAEFIEWVDQAADKAEAEATMTYARDVLPKAALEAVQVVYAAKWGTT